VLLQDFDVLEPQNAQLLDEFARVFCRVVSTEMRHLPTSTVFPLFVYTSVIVVIMYSSYDLSKILIVLKQLVNNLLMMCKNFVLANSVFIILTLIAFRFYHTVCGTNVVIADAV